VELGDLPSGALAEVIHRVERDAPVPCEVDPVVVDEVVLVERPAEPLGEMPVKTASAPPVTGLMKVTVTKPFSVVVNQPSPALLMTECSMPCPVPVMLAKSVRK
jgi:hypothetical protein